MEIHSLFSALVSTPSTFGSVLTSDETKLFQKIQEARGELRLGSLDSSTLSPAYCDALWPAKAISIQSFRPPSLLFNTPQGLSNLVHRTFRSSGTSQGVDLRSVSRFSKAGLHVYKTLSKKTFFAALKIRLGQRFDQGKIQLFSLVPQTSLWPDSSLSQMIEWVGEDISIVYCTEQSVSECVAQAFKKDPNLLAVVIGTGFHFINSYDSGVRLDPKFASNYCLMETGGTKGKSRDVARKEFYSLLCEYGSISLDQIISEYGMSELACQAYDVVSSDQENVALGSRFFRFPFWAPVAVMVGDAQCRRSGQGALMVDDLSRIDLQYPIITEDLAELFQDKTFGTCFRLMGRIPKAPLKGCSTLVEPFSISHSLKPNPAQILNESTFAPDKVNHTFDFDKASSWINSVLDDQEFFKLLCLEFESETVAEFALSDLRSGFEITDNQLKRLQENLSLKTLCKRNQWFVIAPNNHSLATLSIIYLALACKIPLQIRLPKSEFAVLKKAIALANTQNKSVKTVANHWTAKDFTDIQNKAGTAFFVFGTDETVGKIKETIGLDTLVVGFGSRIGVTLTPSSQVDGASLEAIFRDNVNLRQRGCRSARLNIIIDGHAQNRKKITSQLKDLAVGFFCQKISSAEIAALSIECARYRRLGAMVESNTAQGVVSVGIHLSERSLSPMSIVKEMISSYEGVFPIVFLTSSQLHEMFFRQDFKNSDFNLFSAHSSLLDSPTPINERAQSRNLEVCKLGSMGVQSLDSLVKQIENSFSSTL